MAPKTSKKPGRVPGSQVLKQIGDSAKDMEPVDPVLVQRLADKMAELSRAKDSRKKADGEPE